MSKWPLFLKVILISVLVQFGLNQFGLNRGANATETEQFTVPREPLMDIGQKLDDKILLELRQALLIENKRIHSFKNKAWGDDLENTVAETEARVIAGFISRLSGGIVYSQIEDWLENLNMVEKGCSKNIKFTPKTAESAYKGVWALPVPIAFYFNAATYNVYGIPLGTDKIGHFFQQGYGYLQIARREDKKGNPESVGEAKAVKWGRTTETLLYGEYMMDGIWSNGDLAANFAGMKFLKSLFKPVKMGEKIIPPLIVKKNGSWVFSDRAKSGQILRPFMTEHLCEAINSNHYLYSNEVLRKNVQERCDKWKNRYPQWNKAALLKLRPQLKTWHGEDYGFYLGKGDEISILSECFKEPNL